MCVITHLRSIFVTSFGDEYHVALHMTGSFVMLAMGYFPGKVRDEEGRVTDKADTVVERLRRRK